jgi:hypothetical protein
MTALRKTIAPYGGISLAVAMMIIGEGSGLLTKQQCWEECTHEIAGRCFLWKKRCEMLPAITGKPLTGLSEELFRQQATPRQNDSRDGTLNPGGF